jgi:hypothetical protein
MTDTIQTRTDEVIARARAWRATHMPQPAEQPTTPGALLQLALNLARNGYYVFPLVPRDKMPLAGGNGYHDATRDEGTIRARWKATPNANVGINLQMTGIVDIAPDSAEWADRFRANGMPRTMLYSSGGGAGHWHAWYRLPKGGPVARACVKGQYDIMSEGNAVAPGSIHPSGRAYELRTKLLPVEDLPPAPQWAIDMLQTRTKVDRKEHTPEAWADLPSGAVAAHSRRFQALCKANDQLRAVVAGDAVSVAGDSSVSAQRAVFVNQLIRAHYPHNEIRALAEHFSGVLESNHKWFKTDIDRLIDKYTPQGYSPESTAVLAVTMRGGRHYEITTDELLNAYQRHATDSTLEWTVNEAAKRLNVSTGTIKRREAELIAAGQIRRDYGRVVLLENRSQRIAMPQTADNLADNIMEVEAETNSNNVTVCSDEAESVYETTIGSQFVPPQQDAVNVPERAVCKEQARTRNNTSPPVDLDPPAPNRDLLSFVRSLSAAAAEPGWFLRDYAGWSQRALHDEAERLGAVLDATEDGEAIHADMAAEHWKRTTDDGRRFARLDARRARDAAGVERLRSVLHGSPGRAGECVLSTAFIEQGAMQL